MTSFHTITGVQSGTTTIPGHYPNYNTIKSIIPNISLEYKFIPLSSKLAKQRIKDDIKKGVGRANVSDDTIDRHSKLYEQMLEDIKNESIIETNIDKDTQLGLFPETVNRTEQGNVVIKSVYQKAGVEYAKSIDGIFSMRLDNTNKHFGNPFTGSDKEIDGYKILKSFPTVKESGL